MKTIIYLKKIKYCKELILIRNNFCSVKLSTQISTMESCGWFVTHMVKRTDKTNLLLTSVEIKYTLRDEGVQKGCYLTDLDNPICAVCKKTYIIT